MVSLGADGGLVGSPDGRVLGAAAGACSFIFARVLVGGMYARGLLQGSSKAKSVRGSVPHSGDGSRVGFPLGGAASAVVLTARTPRRHYYPGSN